MDKSIIYSIKESSGLLDTNLTEETSSSDITSTQDLLGSLVDTKYNDSLVYQLCDVQPMSANFGKVYAARKKTDSDDMEIIHKDINTKTYQISTGFTIETLQDINAMFNKSTKKSVQNIVKGMSAKEENKSLLTLLYQESTTKPALTISDSGSFESVIFQLSQKIAESVIEMNQEYYKTLDSFCVLHKDFAASILGSFDYMSEGTEKSLFVGRIGRTDFYINPFPNTSSQFTQDFDYAYESEDTSIPNYCYVGLKSKTSGNSSVTFGPYIYDSQYITDPDTLNQNLIVRNRYGLVTSPLHEVLTNNSMIHKFELIKG